MALPPFPSHDLAKLVLGYLAEEQLMTAYDEFLQASPYLDVFRNEYDRIFMTSLKSILAEYRAVKIYVETCKPFLLRKKLFQCSNLLEVVKFLVNHIDIGRLQAQEPSTEISSSNRQTLYTKSNGCDICYSLNRNVCECRSKASNPVPLFNPASQIHTISKETSIETTSLADLPGSVVKRNFNRELPTDIAHSQTNVGQQITQSSPAQSQSSLGQISQSGLIQPLPQTSLAQHISESTSTETILQRCSVQQTQQRPLDHQEECIAVKNPYFPSSMGVRPQLSSVQNLQSDVACNRQDVSGPKSDEAKQKMEEFNTIYNLVCTNNISSDPLRSAVLSNSNKPIYNAGSFQEFATGVAGIASDKEKPTVPDSSTSENFNTQVSSLNENVRSTTPVTNIKGLPVGKYFLKATVNSPYVHVNQNNIVKSQFIRIKEKPEEQKVTILSDVKVDNTFRGNMKMPTDPLMQMQTIYINGTPAYTNKRQMAVSMSYTKDEIMAMPTIIVVPSSGHTQSSASTYSQSTYSCSTNTITTATSSTPRVLSPLVIDVPSNSPPTKKILQVPDLSSEDPKKAVLEGLVKTVDITAASLPKDSNIAVPNKTSTPNALPPARKSSSTPRRNSHVRVLDFATPRRILHEALNENEPNQLSIETSTNNNEAVPNSLTDIPIHTNIVKDGNYDKADCNKSKSNSSKENKTKLVKKNNWDAELRALVLGKEEYEKPVPTLKSKPKRKKEKKRKKNKVSPAVESFPETSDSDNTKSLKSTSITMKPNESEILTVESVEQLNKDVTPNNLVAESTNNVIKCDRSDTLDTTVKSQMKVNTSDERLDTPEAERISLQNAIGAKLNISDLLETPYKQVLYDIQMETPKFLGAGLPEEPISDVKITSIPTPLFFNTPKPLQATPYASRPTDYSSGSSYYKPDDHDYVPPIEVLQDAKIVTENMSDSAKETSLINPKDKENSGKSGRPQRKCTRNVSYRSPVCISKTKYDESFEATSVSSEASNKSSRDKKANKSLDTKVRLKSKNKSDTKKKFVIYKSPLKSKSFMKIKPRRATPIKGSVSKGRKKIYDITETCGTKSRKRTISKDLSPNITPIVAAAPTKSRRKSSTPRKLNCTKSFSVETVVQDSCILPSEQVADKETVACIQQDSDNDQLALRWSDEGTQDAKPKDKEELPTSSSLPDEDDLIKIKEYIETSAPQKLVPEENNEGSLQNDLIKRGFDAETAKIIERDLLDGTPIQDTAIQSTSNEETNVNKLEVSQAASDKIESDSSVNPLQVVQEEEEVEEIELSVEECNEDSKNFLSCHFDESTFVPSTSVSKLKDKFSMELCLDNDFTIRLRVNCFTSLFDMDPEELISEYDHKQTEEAVSSICNIEKLYTPIKDARDHCYEIFDSTLTSIDTPLKSEVIYETKVTEIILEVEREDVKEKPENRKRKRPQSGSLDESIGKKSKPDAQYLLKSANIQNIDIESVLSKLHGP